MREGGVEMLELEVLASNDEARAIYDRWGFKPVELKLGAPLAQLEQRLAPADGPTFGFVHVQTDDVEKVERDAAKVLPRLEPDVEVEGPTLGRACAPTRPTPSRRGSRRSRRSSRTRSAVSSSRWASRTAPSSATTLFDRAPTSTSTLSVPEYFGPLPPGDVYALGANPTVVGRLTGADPRRVREVARTAASPGELPPAQELYEQIATVMGVQP